MTEPVTAAERRLLGFIRKSIESFGRPVFNSGYTGGQYVIVGERLVPDAGVVRTPEAYRVTTMQGLVRKGLVDRSGVPIDQATATSRTEGPNA